MKKTIIFDLDGTLVDIEPVFIKILNSLAPEFGYTPLLPDELSNLKQLHLKNFLWQRLGLRIFLFPFIVRRGREEYHKLIPEVKLFTGITELLSALRSHECSIGIVSSSRKETITALMQKFNIPMDFIYQCGLFNKSKTLLQILRERNIEIAEAIYVGDEVRDIEACQKTGLDIVAVTWGLNNKEALQKAGAETVDTREALLARLMR